VLRHETTKGKQAKIPVPSVRKRLGLLRHLSCKATSSWRSVMVAAEELAFLSNTLDSTGSGLRHLRRVVVSCELLKVEIRMHHE
jgi:hypothetical protein